MNKQIISVSRRTDIPALYSNWFINRLKEGFAGYINPFNNEKYTVSLKIEDVLCFAFWSKDFTPFIKILMELKKTGYNSIFNFTINNLPKIFEPNVCKTEDSINTLISISKMFSPKHINWRYDPIILSSITDSYYHSHNFEKLCKSLKGYVERCYFSFPTLYKKVERNFKIFEKQNNIKIFDTDIKEKINLSKILSEIASNYNINMYSCCNDELINQKIKKGHCIDRVVITSLFNEGNYLKINSTRKDCGCVQSKDIGGYNTCTNGCIYCYANVNKSNTFNNFNINDNSSPFLKNSNLGTKILF
jgi:hypothetical protein